METWTKTIIAEVGVEEDSRDILKVQWMINSELSDMKDREKKEPMIHVNFSCSCAISGKAIHRDKRHNGEKLGAGARIVSSFFIDWG